MISLFVDTAASIIVIGILKDEEVLYQVCEENNHEVSKNLLPMIKEAFDTCHMNPADIERIYVVTGPGSFTGIRVGVTVAKTLAWALKKEIVPISELELLSSTPFVGDYAIPYIDARRGYGYTAIYDHTLSNIHRDCHMEMETFLKQLNPDKNYVIISNDSCDYSIPVVKPNIDLAKIIKKHKNDASINAHECNPNYLKLTEAEENLLKQVN